MKLYDDFRHAEIALYDYFDYKGVSYPIQYDEDTYWRSEDRSVVEWWSVYNSCLKEDIDIDDPEYV